MIKRSKGVTFYAFTFIIFSFFRFFGSFGIPGTYNFAAPGLIVAIVIYSLISNVGLFFAGLQILKLKQLGRKLALILTAIGLVYMFTVSAPLTWDAINAIQSDPKYTSQIDQAYNDFVAGKSPQPPQYLVNMKEVASRLDEERNRIEGRSPEESIFQSTPQTITKEDFTQNILSVLRTFAWRGTWISIAYLLSVLIFFNLPKVKRQFKLEEAIKK